MGTGKVSVSLDTQSAGLTLTTFPCYSKKLRLAEVRGHAPEGEIHLPPNLAVASASAHQNRTVLQLLLPTPPTSITACGLCDISEYLRTPTVLSLWKKVHSLPWKQRAS